VNNSDYIRQAFAEAFQGIRSHKGGPFGAVVVLDGKVIGKGCNQVTSTNDPTAHAEVVAIRNACRELKSFHLDGAVLYATGEPCPMCLSAIYWAKIGSIFYAQTRLEAERIGFIDKMLYEELIAPVEKRKISITQVDLPEGKELYGEWMKMQDRIQY
jgi:tRNA(Arg) A34 adenosine deaminase TadA